MFGSKLPYYAKKAFYLGPQKSIVILKNRIKTKVYSSYWRTKARKKKAAHTWQTVAQTLNAPQHFSTFFVTLQTKSFTQLLELTPQLPPDQLIALADRYTNNCFDLLGSGNQCFTTMPWHEDFRLKAHNSTADSMFDRNVFYKDILITPGTTDQLVKDIKVPWELSRFQHLAILGKAYEFTNDKKYAHTFVSHVTDWIDNSPYMLGVNWVCPMEVGIRSLNWIWAFHFFKQESSIPAVFWQRFVCSLYDHMHYLENNWEFYDGQTSNHYLSDLIGYFYLCRFFEGYKGIEEKLTWCYQELLREFDKQIFDEGTDYEGSTAYHKLVTEIFFHAYLLSKELNITPPTSFTKKLEAMVNFIAQCTLDDGSLLQIGDNDSGTLLYSGLNQTVVEHMHAQPEKEIAHYSAFGLSFIKNNTWHISLHHHAYENHQPSGHMHNDALSITLAIHGIPIFIDPGSYIYTPSSRWRNYFRSASAHNTFFLEHEEPAPFDERLFALELPEENVRNKPTIKNNVITLSSEHSLYKRFGLRAQRTLSLDTAQNQLTITDRWLGTTDTPYNACWNFTLHPAIEAQYIHDHWQLLHDNKPLVHLQSDELVFELQDTWVSFGYGSKIKSNCLRARKKIDYNKTTLITIASI